MFERFTDDARTIIVDSQAQARTLGHQTVGTERLPLGLADARAGSSSQILAQAGITAELVREQLLARRAAGEPIPAETAVPWTQPAKKLLELSLRQMLERNDPDIGPEHMLLASAQVDRSGSRAILGEFGMEFEQLKRRVDEQRSR